MIPRSRGVAAQPLVAAVLSAALVLAPLLVMVGVLFNESTKSENSWSPYYKVQTNKDTYQNVPLLTITVNGVPHQQAIPADARLQWEPQYGLPYERANAGKAPKNVLIIGAGSGSDVAIALKKGARACRRGRDRPADPRHRQGAAPGPPVPGPAGDRRTSTTGGRSCPGPTRSTT